MKIAKNLLNNCKVMLKKLNEIVSDGPESYKPAYRIVNIEQDEAEEYHVTVQIIGKSVTYKTKPEKLLADDKLVNMFPPTDIRNLTYLGYLGINAPKYKILAKQLHEDKGETLFAIHTKGKKKRKIVTAKEISTNQDFIEGLSQKDAHMVGFTSATEQAAAEEKQKKELLKQLKG